MAPKLAATSAGGAKRAAASWGTGHSGAKFRALHYLSFVDSPESSPVSPKKQGEDPEPFVRRIQFPRKAPGREGKHREVPRLLPVDSTRITDYKFTKLWADKVKRKSPLIVRHMPGFLESQNWFQHPESNPAGEFTSRTPLPGTKPKENKPSFAVLRDSIIADALRKGDTDNRSAMGQLFDSLGVKFKIKRTNIANEELEDPKSQVKLEKFLHWLVKTGRSSSHNLDGTVDRLLKSAKDSSLIWEPFDAPLAFVREILQYNHEMGVEGRHSEAISRLAGLIELEDHLTEDFPYPPKVREVSGLKYDASSCSIRFGIRPLRSDLRRSTDITVVGQLAGYSRVLLVPPKLKSLGGWDSVVRLSSRPVKALQKSIWTAGFEETIPERMDASLRPGEVLLIPDGWWYGIRSINNANQLHATVGWYLQTDESPYKLWQERQAREERNFFRTFRA
ncbi:Clavaminate synthase-like protein [Apiospora aurea]|uniref:Clavaminate synthase-like protein n=1 Tax=Apiospora aurea TaxID=335848 RepID=A0ABR1QQ38_9PEZI